MTPERIARIVERWVRCYTRGMPPVIAERRVEEIAVDVSDHIAHERASGVGEGGIAFDILSRMARGLPADVSWRRRIQPLKGDLMKSYIAILAGALCIAALGVLAILFGSGDDSPGLVLIGVLLIVGAFALGVRTAQRSR